MDMESTLDKDYPPRVSLDSLSELTGFSKDMIKKELLLDGEDITDIGLDELRKIMTSFLDRSMLES